MKFAGFQELSLQDYPGKMSVIIFTQGCNLNCWWCFNPDMIPKKKFKKKISEKIVINHILEKNKYQIWVDAITICGGEPTIQKDLEKFLVRLRKEIPYLKIKLDTNGTNPTILKRLIHYKLLDYIAMDVKISQIGRDKYMESIELTKKFIKDKDGEFRATMHPGIIEFEEKTKKMSKLFGETKIYFQPFSRKGKLNRDTFEVEYSPRELKEFKKGIKKSFKEGKVRW